MNTFLGNWFFEENEIKDSDSGVIIGITTSREEAEKIVTKHNAIILDMWENINSYIWS